MSGTGWTTFGSAGSGINQFSQPMSIFVSAAGQIFVADRRNSRIVRINDMRAEERPEVGSGRSGCTQFNNPRGIFVSSAGQIFVADGGGCSPPPSGCNDRIVRFNDMTGTGWTTFGASGSGTNQFGGPAGIFVSAAGQIFVADRWNSRIVRINDMIGTGWATFGANGSGINQFSGPIRIFVR